MSTESKRKRAVMLDKDWKTRKGGSKVLSLEFTATDWYADIDARDWLAIVMDRVLRFIADKIKRGLLAGRVGKQRPLLPASRDDPTRRSPHRGYATGVLVDGLTREKITGGAGRARTTIREPADRRGFFEREAERGNIYLAAGGDVEKLVVRVATEYIQDAVDAGEGTFDTASLAAAREARKVRKKGPRRPGGLSRRGRRRKLVA